MAILIRKCRRKGQLSIEFLLVAAFLLAFAAVLLNTAETQLRETQAVDSAALSKAAADSLGTLVNTVFLQGNGAQLNSEFFVPKNSVCFFVNGSVVRGAFLECDPDPQLSGRVRSRLLYTANVTMDSGCPPTDVVGGWYAVTVRNVNGWVALNCTRTV